MVNICRLVLFPKFQNSPSTKVFLKQFLIPSNAVVFLEIVHANPCLSQATPPPARNAVLPSYKRKGSRPTGRGLPPCCVGQVSS